MNGGLLLALGGALAAVLAGSAVLPAVGGLMGAYRLASVGWRVASVMGSGRFTPVEGAGGDVLKWVPASGCRLAALEQPQRRERQLCDTSSGAQSPQLPPPDPSATPALPARPRRLDLWWRPLPVVFLPLSAALVRERDGWVLVDAGAGNSWSQAYATKCAPAAKVCSGVSGAAVGSAGAPERPPHCASGLW